MTQTQRSNRIFVLLLLISIAMNCLASGTEGEKKKKKESKRDTATAVVMYGDDMILGSRWGNYHKHFESYLEELSSSDSISTSLQESIDLCKSLNRMNPEQLSTVRDSLFELDEIPFALINEINFQLAHYEFNPKDVDFDFMIPYDHSPYPANYFYQSWNTLDPSPYDYSLSEGDTTVMLQLKSELMNCDFHMPFDGVVTSKYGWRDGRNHNGYDIDLEVWDPVHASFGGVVRLARYYGNFGRLVVIRHYNGLETFYAHLHRFKVKPGDIVEAGDIIGLGGSSGRSTGSHLHFEMRFKGLPLNPAHIISFHEKELHADTLILQKTNWGYNAFPKGVKLHYVEKGESLSSIAQSYGIALFDLCQDNGLHRRSYLRKGQRLMIKVRNELSNY
ncbi:MAG: M23 family metallopeptidase [Bacteroidota bacterium]